MSWKSISIICQITTDIFRPRRITITPRLFPAAPTFQINSLSPKLSKCIGLRHWQKLEQLSRPKIFWSRFPTLTTRIYATWRELLSYTVETVPKPKNTLWKDFNLLQTMSNAKTASIKQKPARSSKKREISWSKITNSQKLRQNILSHLTWTLLIKNWTPLSTPTEP